jgi:hypothetical protein
MSEQAKEPATITISKKFFEELVEDSDFLDCLRACGVDNWNGYSDARQMYNENEAEDKEG